MKPQIRRSMLSAPILAVLLLAVPLSGRATKSFYRYNWTTGADSGGPVHAGRPVMVAVEGG